MNQECDLRFDYLARNQLPAAEGKPPVKLDKLLRNILLCPAFPADHVLAGTYIQGAFEWRGTRKDILLGNRDERFHILEPEEPYLSAQLALDFKLVVAATPSYLEQWIMTNPASSVAAMEPPYRDRLLQRFVGYFARIAEPDDE